MPRWAVESTRERGLSQNSTTWDIEQLRARIVSPWLPEACRRVTKWERELADTCLESGRVERWANLCSAVPVFEGDYKRVIVVCEVQQLSLRP